MYKAILLFFLTSEIIEDVINGWWRDEYENKNWILWWRGLDIKDGVVKIWWRWWSLEDNRMVSVRQKMCVCVGIQW